MRVFYSEKYWSGGSAFETIAKSRAVADAICEDWSRAYARIEEPEPLRYAALRTAHSAEYVQRVRTRNSGGGLRSRNHYQNVVHSNGGVVAATLAAMRGGVSGSLSSGLHHARYDDGFGFCTFNGLAIAAQAAIDAGAMDVMILDLDAHGGGGTDDIVRGWPEVWHLDVAINHFDEHPVRPGRGSYDVQPDRAKYLALVERRLDQALAVRHSFNVCIYNAGMDVVTGRPTDVDVAFVQAREQLVFSWMSHHAIPVAFVLAGGYRGYTATIEDVAGLHMETVREAVRALQRY